MKRLILVPLLAALALPLSVVLAPDDAEAIPAFARQVKQKCTYCHVAFPKLNEFGLTFKTNGYRLQGTKGTDVWEIPAWPVAALAEIEGEWNDTVIPGGDSLTITQPGLEVFWGTTFGPRISSFGEIEVERGEGADLGPVFVQFNDLVGEGQLNLKVGVFDVDFPFLSAARDIMFSSYGAEDLGFYPTVVGAELNGQILPEDEGLTLRYYAGFTLDANVNASQSDVSESGYLTFAATFMEQKVGLHYQHQAGDEGDQDRWGVATELTAGGAFLTLGYFNVSQEAVGGGDDQDGTDLLVEVLYPWQDYVFGVRWDNLDDAGFNAEGDVEKWTAHASWYARPNLQIGAEFRLLDYNKKGASSFDEDDTKQGRLIARFGF